MNGTAAWFVIQSAKRRRASLSVCPECGQEIRLSSNDTSELKIALSAISFILFVSYVVVTIVVWG